MDVGPLNHEHKLDSLDAQAFMRQLTLIPAQVLQEHVLDQFRWVLNAANTRTEGVWPSMYFGSAGLPCFACHVQHLSTSLNSKLCGLDAVILCSVRARCAMHVLFMVGLGCSE